MDTPETTENDTAARPLHARVLPRLRWIVLKYRLYRVMPVRWSARLLLRKPSAESIEWARKQIERAR